MLISDWLLLMSDRLMDMVVSDWRTTMLATFTQDLHIALRISDWVIDLFISNGLSLCDGG